MSYFEELPELPDYKDQPENFRFSYNQNSGGGQAFLQGRFRGPEDTLTNLVKLEGKIATFQFETELEENNPLTPTLDDPFTKYEIKPRAAGESQMKLVVQHRKQPSKAIASFLMLPITSGVRTPKNLEYSILSSENYWLQTMRLRCTHYDPQEENVTFSPADLIFAGGADKSSPKEEIRYFRLNWRQRIRDIIYLAASRKLDDEIRDFIDFFAEIYKGVETYSYEACASKVTGLMRVVAEKFPDQYSGITDPLPLLTRHAWGSVQQVESTFETPDNFDSSWERNRIVFGAPGTGKSYFLDVEKERLLHTGGSFERVTFHPEYSYSHFVGTYKPVPVTDSDENETITYRYVPGPFMRVLVSALKSMKADSSRPSLLLIEEINRANAAAVFGEVFQLLDRSGSHESEYPITPSEEMRDYLAGELGGLPSDFDYLRIPGNMFIWATMNSADQGVFPMDTAFKRRWSFSYMGIDESDEELEEKFVILGSGTHERSVEWNSLRKAINAFLTSRGVNEDKLMGPYFLSKQMVVPSGDSAIDSQKFIEAFKSKVIMYLFDDAAKQHRLQIFQGAGLGNLRYSEICEKFMEIGVGIFPDEITGSIPIDKLKRTDVIQTPTLADKMDS